MYSILNKREVLQADEIVTVCAWCHRAKMVTKDFRIVWSDNYSIGQNQFVSHTICPSCKERVMADSAELVAFG